MAPNFALPDESQVWSCFDIAQPSHHALIIIKRSVKSYAGTVDLSKPLAHPVNTFTLTGATKARSPHTRRIQSTAKCSHELMSVITVPQFTSFWVGTEVCGLWESAIRWWLLLFTSSKETISCVVYIIVPARSPCFSPLRFPTSVLNDRDRSRKAAWLISHVYHALK